MTQIRRLRAGGWLPHDPRHIDSWIRDLKIRVTERPQPLAPPIQELKNMVDQDPASRARCQCDRQCLRIRAIAGCA